MKKIKFKDFIKLQRGYDLPKSQIIEGKYPVVGSTSIIGFHNEYKQVPPGVITGRSGSLGVVQYITKPYWPHNTSLWVRDFRGNLPRYVYYFLHTLPLEKFNAGAGVPTLNRNHLDNLDIYIHDASVQNKISSILSAYDNLIENNTRRIQILEEMAQRIYQEWFVNFRFSGHKKVKFVNSELGKIPDGWEVVSLGDICYIEKNKYKETEHSTLPLLDLARIPRKSLAINSLGPSCELKTSRIIFRKGSVLFGSIRPYFHKVFYAFCDGVTNTSVFVIKAVEPIPISFLFSLLFSKDSVNWANQNSGGTKMPVISWDVFKTMKVISPNKKLLNKYDSIISSFLDNICILNLKNLKLKQTRDLLLPKLISGELDVSNLDIAVKEQGV